MSILTLDIEVKLEDDGWWSAKIVGNDFKFYSRYRLWAEAHCFQWYADELIKIQKLTTPVD